MAHHTAMEIAFSDSGPLKGSDEYTHAPESGEEYESFVQLIERLKDDTKRGRLKWGKGEPEEVPPVCYVTILIPELEVEVLMSTEEHPATLFLSHRGDGNGADTYRDGKLVEELGGLIAASLNTTEQERRIDQLHEFLQACPGIPRTGSLDPHPEEQDSTDKFLDDMLGSEEDDEYEEVEVEVEDGVEGAEEDDEYEYQEATDEIAADMAAEVGIRDSVVTSEALASLPGGGLTPRARPPLS